MTGGFGFIGSNIIKLLNGQGHSDITVVDNLKDKKKFFNFNELQIKDFVPVSRFYDNVEKFDNFDVIFHSGANSSTVDWHGENMLMNNFSRSKELLNLAASKDIRFIYASSASVYGSSELSDDSDSARLSPINVYAYSKLLFDNYVRELGYPNAVGLRYFNVYGPGESHKGEMASAVYQFIKQNKTSRVINLFGAHDGYSAGDQSRDFIYVDDICKINLMSWLNPIPGGVYNIGTGSPVSFNSIANKIIEIMGYGQVRYIPFPDKLKNSYQSFTKANLTKFHKAYGLFQHTEIYQGLQNYINKF